MATLATCVRTSARAWGCGALLIASVALAGGAPQSGRAQTVSEYGLKALFLFNFTQFVEWPSTAFASPDTPLCIGILGDDPFGATIDEAVRGESIGGRPLSVRRSRDVATLGACHVVFISGSERDRVEKILAQLDAGPTLTVGEIEGFARRGGVIGFYRDGSKIRFEISPDTARRKDLKISSQLLSLGRIVEPSES